MKKLLLAVLVLPILVFCQTIPNGIVIEGFGNIRDWTLGDIQSYDRLDRIHHTEGTSSILLGTNSTLVVPTITKKVYTYLRNYSTFSIDLYSPGVPKQNKNIRVEFSSKSFDNSNLCANITAGTRIYKGWNRLVFDKADFALRIGAESWENIMKKLRISEWVDKDTSSITFDNFRAYPTKAAPVAIITLDDGLVTQKTIAKPILDSLGLKATIFVFGKAVNSVNRNYLRWRSLDSLYNEGWDISNHTYSHTSLLNLSGSVLEAEVNGMRDTLVKHGYLRSCDFFSYPMGDFDPIVLSKVKEKHALARTVNDWQYLAHPSGIGDDYYLLREHNEIKTYPEQCKDIDRAISRGQLLVYLFHDVSSYSGKFSAIMHYIKSKQDAGLIKVMTMSQYYQFLLAARINQPAATDNQPLATTDPSLNLLQNYPNPFNATTSIKYELREDGNARLVIINMLGQEVLTLFNGYQSAGWHQYNFDAAALSSGIYLYKLEAHGIVTTKKMLLLK